MLYFFTILFALPAVGAAQIGKAAGAFGAIAAGYALAGGSIAFGVVSGKHLADKAFKPRNKAVETKQ